METNQTTFNPEKITTNYKLFIRFLPVGKKNAKTKAQLFKKYVEALKNFDEGYRNGTYKLPNEKDDYQNFARITRSRSEEARKAGEKVLNTSGGENAGIWYCASEEEYQEYRQTQINTATKMLQQLADMEQKSLKSLISEVFATAKKKELKLLSFDLFNEEGIINDTISKTANNI